MFNTRKLLSILLAMCLGLGFLPALAEDATPFYKTLDAETKGTIDIMVWSGDSIFYEDIGARTGSRRT